MVKASKNIKKAFERLFCFQILSMQVPMIIWFGFYLNRRFFDDTVLDKYATGRWEAVFPFIFTIAFLVAFSSSFFSKKVIEKRGDIGTVFLINLIVLALTGYGNVKRQLFFPLTTIIFTH